MTISLVQPRWWPNPTAQLIVGSFLVAGVLACATLSFSGTDPHGVVRALQATARFSFLLFWCAYVGGAARTLFGIRFAPLAMQARAFGLAFAAAHLVHVILIVWLFWISDKPPVTGKLFVFFTVGLFWTYLLAVLSIQGMAQKLNPHTWRVVRFVGAEYISLAFLSDFATHSLHGLSNIVAYLPFLILSVLGTSMRLAAFVSRRSPVRIAS